MNNKINIGRTIGYSGLLILLCVTAFLVAKYIIRSRLGWEDPPVDVSERA